MIGNTNDIDWCLWTTGYSSQIAASWGLVASVHTVTWPSKCHLHLLSIRECCVVGHILHYHALPCITPTKGHSFTQLQRNHSEKTAENYKIRPPNKVLYSSCSMPWWPYFSPILWEMANQSQLSIQESAVKIGWFWLTLGTTTLLKPERILGPRSSIGPAGCSIALQDSTAPYTSGFTSSLIMPMLMVQKSSLHQLGCRNLPVISRIQ